MKDTFGRELKVGDKIFYSYPSSGSLYHYFGIIQEFTPKMVIIKMQLTNTGAAQLSRVSPTRLTKISEKGLIFQ